MPARAHACQRFLSGPAGARARRSRASGYNALVQGPAPRDSAYRDFAASARPSVRALYRENHARQTLRFVLDRKQEFLPPRRRRMGVWEAIAFLDALVDESDPDLEASQLDHALQTAEALRADGAPRWLVLTGFVHDLGKVLCAFGEPQWAVVGDTFPVGCAFSDRIVYPELFAANPDATDPRTATPLGIYERHCGLDRVHLSWGHDEYLYHVLREHLPPEALAIIRYHSCYVVHREGAYSHLLAPADHEILGWVRRFQPYDLYSKTAQRPDGERLRGYYESLVAEFLPAELWW
jgi:inositol oxygenase